MRDVWVGSSRPTIGRLADGVVTPAGEAGVPAFLAAHPTLARLYAVDEVGRGAVSAFAVDGVSLHRTGTVDSGGSAPCHLTVHPDGRWLYAANYLDGVVLGVALDAAGDLTDERVELAHSGSGPHRSRQDRSHAHATAVTPAGGWLVATDLGTDQLRTYRLRDGRPEGPPVLTSLPPGTGPRHMAWAGDLVHVAGELSTEVLTLRWDEQTGRGVVVSAVGAVTQPPRSGTEHTLSHLEIAGDAVVVGVRGADTVAVVGLSCDGVVESLRAEVPTVAWPRHLTVVDDVVLVAGERSDLIGVHRLHLEPVEGSVRLGELSETISAPAPMCLLPR